jgi:hypothetical protein
MLENSGRSKLVAIIYKLSCKQIAKIMTISHSEIMTILNQIIISL